MKIIVTGGSGFIGTHIVENLLSKKYIATVLDLWDLKFFNLNLNIKFIFL